MSGHRATGTTVPAYLYGERAESGPSSVLGLGRGYRPSNTLTLPEPVSMMSVPRPSPIVPLT